MSEHKCVNCVKNLEGSLRWINPKGRYLDPSKEYTYSFVEGNSNDHDHFRAGLKKITESAPGLKIKEVELDGDFRIGFDPSQGAYSYVGLDNLSIPKNQRTMNIGFTDQYHSVVIHEFLHALNFTHEHFRGINYDKAKTYAYFARLGWDRATVDNNILSFSENSHDFGDFDKESIMLYYIPCEITTDSKNCEIQNTELSTGDIKRLNELFPPPKTPAKDCLKLSLKKVLKEKKDLNRLLETSLVTMATELGLKSDLRFKKSYTIDLIWQHLTS